MRLEPFTDEAREELLRLARAALEQCPDKSRSPLPRAIDLLDAAVTLVAHCPPWAPVLLHPLDPRHGRR